MITIKGPPARIQELGAELDALEGLPKPAVATVRYAEAFNEEGSKKSFLLLDTDETRAKTRCIRRVRVIRATRERSQHESIPRIFD